MADLDTALVQQFLNISVAQWEAVVQPDSLLDNGHRESVAIRLGVGHGGSAYLNPVKATQPAIVLWNTRYMQVVLNDLRNTGHLVLETDVARLTPWLHDHIHMLGKYDFTLSPAVAQGQLRPLRDPSSLEEYLNRIP